MMTTGRRRASVVVVGIEGRVGRRRVVVMAWTLWGSVCALSLLLIALTIAFHLVTRYDWYFGGYLPALADTDGGGPRVPRGAATGSPDRLAPTDQSVRLALVPARSGNGGTWRRLRLPDLGLVCGTAIQPSGTRRPGSGP